MRTIETMFLWVKNTNHKAISFICCLVAFFSFVNVSAQTFPTSCTSKDLTLLRASLPAPVSDPCKCDGKRKLILGIRNGTGSFRTSFALWGTLVRKDASGNVTDSASIFACASGIQPKSDNYLPASTTMIDDISVDSIPISCGESLDILNLHLAWTSASPSETCDVLFKNPSTINPKCGTQDSIHVDIGVDAKIEPTAATCISDGSLKISPFGGIAPYKVKIGSDERTNIQAGGYVMFTLPAGSYSVDITDNRGCVKTKTPEIGSSTAPTAQATGDLISCSHTSGSLSGSGSSTGSNITYLWTGSTTITNSTSISASTTTGGAYTLKVTNSGNGCTATASTSVSVNTTAPSPLFNSDGPITCSHPTATLSVGSAVSGFTYAWSGPGGPIICTPPCTSISVTVGGTYSLKVANNDNGCTAISTATLSANKTAPAARALGDLITCSHTTATLDGTGSATGAGITYLWTGDGTVTNNTSILASTTTGGLYTLKVTDSGNGCTATAAASVSTNTAAPTFTVCITQPTLCTKGSLTIIPDIAGTYHYSIDGTHTYNVNATNVTVTTNNATFSNLMTGDVTSVQISNDNTGCNSTPLTCGSLTTHLSSSCRAATITDRVQQESLILTGQPTVKAYPNPFNDHVKFVINSPSAGDGSLEIYNVMGQKIRSVYQGRVLAGNNSFEVTIPKKDQQTLIYMFRVGDKKVTGKLLQLNN